MTNAERIARDICLLAGRYERGEITAKQLVENTEKTMKLGCAGCVYREKDIMECNNYSCRDGRSLWLDAEAES